MKTIEKGMYVRTEYGIAKVREVVIKNEVFRLDSCIMIDNMDEYMDHCVIHDIIDADEDIIEVIKPGDLVNGELVYIAGFNQYDEWCIRIKEYDGLEHYIYPHEIKTIITKELYEYISYKVGGDE